MKNLITILSACFFNKDAISKTRDIPISFYAIVTFLTRIVIRVLVYLLLFIFIPEEKLGMTWSDYGELCRLIFITFINYIVISFVYFLLCKFFLRKQGIGTKDVLKSYLISNTVFNLFYVLRFVIPEVLVLFFFSLYNYFMFTKCLQSWYPDKSEIIKRSAMKIYLIYVPLYMVFDAFYGVVGLSILFA